jgi:hypothetical protein
MVERIDWLASRIFQISDVFNAIIDIPEIWLEKICRLRSVKSVAFESFWKNPWMTGEIGKPLCYRKSKAVIFRFRSQS